MRGRKPGAPAGVRGIMLLGCAGAGICPRLAGTVLGHGAARPAPCGIDGRASTRAMGAGAAGRVTGAARETDGAGRGSGERVCGRSFPARPQPAQRSPDCGARRPEWSVRGFGPDGCVRAGGAALRESKWVLRGSLRKPGRERSSPRATGCWPTGCCGTAWRYGTLRRWTGSCCHFTGCETGTTREGGGLTTLITLTWR